MRKYNYGNNRNINWIQYKGVEIIIFLSKLFRLNVSVGNLIVNEPLKIETEPDAK